MCDQMDQYINENDSKREALQQTREARLNNARAVKGEGFEESAENLMVLAEL